MCSCFISNNISQNILQALPWSAIPNSYSKMSFKSWKRINTREKQQHYFRELFYWAIRTYLLCIVHCTLPPLCVDQSDSYCVAAVGSENKNTYKITLLLCHESICLVEQRGINDVIFHVASLRVLFHQFCDGGPPTPEQFIIKSPSVTFRSLKMRTNKENKIGKLFLI